MDVELKVGDEAALKRANLSGTLHGQLFWRDNEARQDPGGAYDGAYTPPGHGGRLHENPALFKLIDETFAVTDSVKRYEAFNKLHKVAREETYHLGLGYINIPWAVGPRVAAWQPWPLAFYPSNLHGMTLK